MVYVMRNPRDQIVSLNAYQWWLHFHSNKNVLILFYEDLIQDLRSQIGRIAEFYQLDHVTKELLDEISNKTQFVQMKHSKPVPEWFSDWHKDSFSIYRKGMNGNWQNYFTPAMNDAFQLYSSQVIENHQYPACYQLCKRYISSNPIAKHQEPAEVVERKQEVALAH
ncbi:SULT1E1 [Bugula neritina]|uniref:SULT1E1 n=1 Tax=Bugula neritina TaxID=10212 RepID=A0A7J7K5S4_BUGNE|nr:SULT1E1 [Bugula neritina]